MDNRRLSLRFAALYERFRGSLFYVPAAYIVVAAFGAWGSSQLDREFARSLPDVPFLLPTTVASARSILSTIAGATITVAGVMFSLTVIAVQLASSQFSPRVLRGFLRDRFSQHTIGITVAVFTYCLLVLAGTRGTGQIEEPFQNISVTIAVALSLAAVLAIVAFLNHSARTMQVGEVIRRISEETHDAIRGRYTEDADRTPPPEQHDPDRDPDIVIRVEDEGWVQLIHPRVILEALPPGAVAHLRSRPGAYALPGRPLVDIWGEVEDEEKLRDKIHRAFVIGDERTMQQDVAFGIRQLVDIALRALSPGINDPTTAIEALFRLGGIVRELALRDLPPPPLCDAESDRVLLRSDLLEFDDLVRYAFRQIRVVAVSQPAVITILIRVLGEVADELRRHGLDQRLASVQREARLAIKSTRAQGHIQEDITPLLNEAERFGLA